MKKTCNYFIAYIFFLTMISAQTLCPPAFLTATAGNTEAALSWSAPDTADYGDVLMAECFSSCDSAIYALTVSHDTDNGTGGWFRDSDGDTASCGTGMIPCSDGGDDNYSAVAVYSGEAQPIDSRLITRGIDLTSYTTATLEYTEAYTWSVDAHDSNMVELSTDSGATWTQIAVSRPEDLYTETGAFSDIVIRTVNISSFAGQEVFIAFRYFDATGYGEAWFIDNIRVWGDTGGRSTIASENRIVGQMITLGKKENGLHYRAEYFTDIANLVQNNASRTSPCGTFQSYNVYQDGSLIGNTTENEYLVSGLTNFTEYCFNISAVYAEGESDTSFSSCTMPLDPFIVDPIEISLTVALDEYVESTIIVANHDTSLYDFSVFSMEVSNLQVATELLAADFDLGLWGEMYDADLVWAIADSAGATSIYLEYPDNYSLFAYYNDDAAGDAADPVDTYLTSNAVFLGGDEKVYLMLDMFYPQLGGPCGNTHTDGGLYADYSEIILSTDGGATWTFIDSSYVNGNGWTKMLYNITPYTTNAQLVQIAVGYHDCGGNWGYGIGVDNVAIKQGEDMSWLTISPYEGSIAVGDTINVKVGAYGVSDGFSASEIAVLNAGPYEMNINISMTVGESDIDLPEGIPNVFALHQNFPNPFNPETTIRFDIPEMSFARIDIYNILGQRVRTLFHGSVDPGYHIAKWDGRNDNGDELPTGMYLYKLHAGTYVAMEKLVLLK